jgi:hypothetical protein
MVEAIESCNINQGKCAKRVKSTKSMTNVVDLHYITYDFKIREQFSKVQMIKTLKGNFNFLNLPRNFHAKRQGGEG